MKSFKNLSLILSTMTLLTACENNWEGIKNPSVLGSTGSTGSNSGSSTSGNSTPGTPTPTPTPAPAPAPVPVPEPVPALVCKATEHIEKDVCVANVRACTVKDGAGEETWDGQKYGSCKVIACNNTFHTDGNMCTPNVRACTIANGTGEEVWDGAKFGACMLKTCNANFHIDGNMCTANVRACTIANGVGEEMWDGQKFGLCALKTCNSGYQVTAGQCTKSFVGKFKMPCGPEGTVESIYINDFIDDVKHDLIAKVYYPVTGTCLDQNLYREVRQIGTYQRVGISQSAPGAVEIDFANPQIEITLRSDLAVSEHNLVASCGKTNWVINTPFVFTRAQCNATGGYPKSINKVDGDLLYIGDFSGLKDANGRPLNLILDPKKISTRF